MTVTINEEGTLVARAFETEHLAEFDEDGLPVRTARMTFTEDELALIRSGLQYGVDYMDRFDAGLDQAKDTHAAARAFFDAENWTRGGRDCE